MPKLNRWGCIHGLRWRSNGRLEVSAEYEANVIFIAESDPEVQEYLDDGYCLKGVRPLITPIVGADGYVATKAIHAIYLLENEDGPNYVAVWVDLDEENVTKIVNITRTVIESTYHKLQAYTRMESL